ncbi:MAG TPA: hypothetical protein VK929_15800 [Longimicrobiales bacterium]|nr:hypothetical protein [Longimicrobiales bacterium]
MTKPTAAPPGETSPATATPGLLRRVLPTAAFFVGGLAVGVLAARGGLRVLPELGLSSPQVLIVFAVVPVLYLLCIAAHELGHVLAGRLVDFRMLLFIAGPLRVDRTPDGLRPGLNRSILHAGGLAATVPVGLHDLRRRTIVMVAGGPLASLMVGSQGLALYQATAPTMLRDGAPFPVLLMGLAFLILGGLSLLIGLLTLIPARSGGFYSDGARILRLMRASDETEREVALLALTGLSMAGTRPRDWEPALVARGAGIRDHGAFEVLGRQFAWAHALDSGDIPTARRHLQEALARVEQLPAGARASLYLAGATFFALYDGDAARGRDLLDRAGHGLLPAPHQRQLAEAAVLMAEGDAAGARDAASRVSDLAGSAQDRGGAALDIALADRILLEETSPGGAPRLS